MSEVRVLADAPWLTQDRLPACSLCSTAMARKPAWSAAPSAMRF